MALLAGSPLPAGYTPGKRQIPPGTTWAQQYPGVSREAAVLPSYGGAPGGGQDPRYNPYAGVQSYANIPQYQPQPQGPLPGTTTMPTTQPGQGGVGMESILGAMTTTQQRAMEDRARAMAEIRLGGQRGIGALQPWQASIAQLQAQPETIGAAEESRIYEMGRVPVEAGAQAQLRGMQEQFFPGGFARGMAGGVQEAATGRLGELARRTAMERTLRKRQDMMALMGQQAGYGQAAAGIYGQMGQSLADIYGQTVAAVPQYQQQQQAQPQAAPAQQPLYTYGGNLPSSALGLSPYTKRPSSFQWASK